MNNLSERGIKILASMGLILTTMIWGFAFVVMKNSVDVIPPTYLLAVRFSMSAVLLALLFHKNMMKADRETVLCGVILGAFLCLSYQFQTYGLKHTTASKNAFITTLYVIIVPFLYWIVSKKRPTGQNIAAAFLAVIGLALLSLAGRSLDQLRRFSDAGLRSDVCGPHGIYRQVYRMPRPDRPDGDPDPCSSYFQLDLRTVS